MNIYNYTKYIHICLYILSLLKLLFDTRKMITRKHKKIIKKVIFTFKNLKITTKTSN